MLFLKSVTVEDLEAAMSVRVSDFIFCLKATNLSEEGPCAKTILSFLNPEYVPGLFSFSVILILLGVDPTRAHDLEVVFYDPNQEAVAQLLTELPSVKERVEYGIPAEFIGVNVAIDFSNVNFRRSGLYQMKVKFDHSEVDEKSIFVRGKNEQ